MTAMRDQNYYIIVGRDGNRPVTRWSPAQMDASIARSGDSCGGGAEPGSYVERANELIDDTAS